MSHTTIPDTVMLAVAQIPDAWPALIEAAKWTRERRRGQIVLPFRDGRLLEFQVNEARGAGPNLVKAMSLDAEPKCPVCTALLIGIDHGEHWQCASCDQTFTIWELTRHPPAGKAP